MRKYLLFFLCLAAEAARCQQDTILQNAFFRIRPEKYGLGGLWKPNDIYPTNYIRPGGVFGDLSLRYRAQDGVVQEAKASEGSVTFRQEGRIVRSYARRPGAAVWISQSFDESGDGLVWKIRLTNRTAAPVTIEDMSVALPYNGVGSEDPTEIFERQLIKHHFIEGEGSYLFFERPTGVGPYLVMTPQKGTGLEYFSEDTTRQVFEVYIHAVYTAGHQPAGAGSWRQPLTRRMLSAHGSVEYGFSFHWAKDYQGVRDVLVRQGQIDIQVMPGMTVPSDMSAEFALRSRAPVNEVIPEFPAHTRLTFLGQRQGGVYMYRVRFAKLGENRLTVRYDGHCKTYLEFFATEPLETLYKKRAAFITDRQQHRDSTKWYDGLFSVWDMKHKVLRGPDNTDGFDGWWGYVLACDDPALCKAPFLAAKNVYYPSQHEVDALEYYIRHFVWGKLQRTDQEKPYPYGIYGTPNWYVNRDSNLRKTITNRNLDKMHVWRSYDYPHLMMLYYHLYQIADRYPGMTHYLDKKGYLERVKETAKAYFTYPYEILPWYETYKWGCYNELLLPSVISDLDREGFAGDAAWLRREWEKKVKYFVYDDKYPFRSEYAIDATAFESTQALAAYGATHEMQPDHDLWYDKNKQKWYSHPVVSRDSARDFMDRQMQANIACRGWLEPAYYYYGSDYRGKSERYTLSYMAQMGGWGILDYALRFAKAPSDYIRLGYASYLSSFALMNTGTAASGYGAWYPGKENDGASGWAFEPMQYGHTWIRKTQGRGPWYYDGEIDLGYGGATRAAATIVTEDPVFGWVAYGGDLRRDHGAFYVVPRDGLRERLYYVKGDARMGYVLERDGWAADREVMIDPAGQHFAATIENRSGDAHRVRLTVTGMQTGVYRLQAGGEVSELRIGQGDAVIEISVRGAQTKMELSRNAVPVR